MIDCFKRVRLYNNRFWKNNFSCVGSGLIFFAESVPGVNTPPPTPHIALPSHFGATGAGIEGTSWKKQSSCGGLGDICRVNFIPCTTPPSHFGATEAAIEGTSWPMDGKHWFIQEPRPQGVMNQVGWTSWEFPLHVMLLTTARTSQMHLKQVLRWRALTS